MGNYSAILVQEKNDVKAYWEIEYNRKDKYGRRAPRPFSTLKNTTVKEVIARLKADQGSDSFYSATKADIDRIRKRGTHELKSRT